MDGGIFLVSTIRLRRTRSLAQSAPMSRPIGTSLLLALALSASGAERTVDLDAEKAGAPPSGFTSVTGGAGDPGKWVILADDVPPLLPSFNPNASKIYKKNVIAQTSEDIKRGRYPMLFFDEKDDFTDFECSFRFKVANGILLQSAGMVFRAQDKDNYYVIRADTSAKVFGFSKFVGGEMAGAPIAVNVPVEKGQWHEMTVRCKGNQISVYLDGKQAIPTMTDNSYRKGKVGFWTQADTVAYFSDIQLTFKRKTNLAQQLVAEIMEKYGRLEGMEIYTILPDKPGIHLIASNKPEDIGKPGGKTEEEIMQTGAYAYGTQKKKKIATVVQPLRDRNGDPIAAVRFTMDRFRGETQKTSVAKTMPMLRDMQRRVASMSDLVD